MINKFYKEIKEPTQEEKDRKVVFRILSVNYFSIQKKYATITIRILIQMNTENSISNKLTYMELKMITQHQSYGILYGFVFKKTALTKSQSLYQNLY